MSVYKIHKIIEIENFINLKISENSEILIILANVLNSRELKFVYLGIIWLCGTFLIIILI